MSDPIEQALRDALNRTKRPALETVALNALQNNHATKEQPNTPGAEQPIALNDDPALTKIILENVNGDTK